MPASREITVVTDRGQTSIPARLRRKLALTQGQHLRWEQVGERELRVVILEPPAAAGAEAMRGWARRFRKTRPTAEWMTELREGES